MRPGAVVAAGVVAAVGAAAAGDEVRVEMQGTVTGSADPAIEPGDAVVVRFAYDATSSSTSGPSIPRLYAAATLLEFQVGDVSWGSPTGGSQLVYEASDRYVAQWNTGGDLQLSLVFDGFDDTLHDDSLPTAIELQGLTDLVLGAFQPTGDLVQFSFDAEGISIVAVPLPPAVWAGLAGLGAVGLMGGLRRRRLDG